MTFGAIEHEDLTVNFGPAHYVPVLKIKRAEKSALEDLGARHPGRFTPLLEIVSRKADKPLSAHIDTTFDKLFQSVAMFTSCFLDTRELATDGEAASLNVFERARAEGMDFVPVVGFTRPVGNAAALQYRENGVALRITREEMEAGGLAHEIHEFLHANALTEHEVDLVMDMGDVSDMIAVGVSLLACNFLQHVPSHTKWRTFTLSGCAFPSSMGKVGRNAHLLVDRSEWVAWKDLYNQRANLGRLPTFSDCAIQHPKGVEGFDPKTMAASASARHATGDHWLLVKGESTKVRKSSTQFPKIAKSIVTNRYGSHYRGRQHCTGCKLIDDAAIGAPNLGSAEKWRLIGSIHHVSTVLKDLSALHWP